MSDLSRRSFVTTGALGLVGLAGLSLTGCAPQGTDGGTSGSEDWNKEADVVVVGFGGAGGAAAIEAHAIGASVILLDANQTPGGASSINGGVIQAAGSSVQKEAGINDTAEQWLECLRVEIGVGFNEDHMKAMTQGSAETIDWLLSLGASIPAEIHQTDTRAIPDSGLYFSDASLEFFPELPPTPRGHTLAGHGGGFIKALQSGVDQTDIEVLLETPATQLVQDEEGRVIGVIAKTGGKELRIRAHKGVIVSTGHFSFNEDMVAKHLPQALQLAKSTPSAHPSATGDGQRMCGAVGAELVGMGNGTFYQYGAGYETGIRSIYVNKFAQRYWSEQGYHENYRGTMLMQQPDQVGFAIFDEGIRAQYEELASGDVEFSANSIEELAAACGLSPQALQGTVSRYNSYCEQRSDPEFGKPADFLVPLATPPFHAVSLAYSWMTSGGMSIDTEARVLDVDGKAIPGLYAAGMCAAGAYGKQNPGSGLNMAWNFYTGRLAGKSATTQEMNA